MKRKGKKIIGDFFQSTYLFVIFMFLYLPVVVLMVYSFNESKSRGNWGGFSFKWYVELFKDSALLSAFYYTVAVAIISSLIACVIGTAASFGINAFKKKSLRAMINTVTNIPVVSPDIVTGVSLMILFVALKIPRGFTTMLLSHITFNIPYVILSVMPKIAQLDKNIYEAALDLGAKPYFAFRKVIIPQIMPGIINGLLLSFTMSIDDFIISFFTTGNGVSNLSIYVYSMAKRGLNPKINALSTIMFIVVIVLLFIVNKRSSKDKSKNVLFS
ncbi:MAG: ABC transporter permease [Ruminococcaceae bacterium]|nr:ABC transporter permease [Oscillospiraceae bacterium]